jgi:hypothetical protein
MLTVRLIFAFAAFISVISSAQGKNQDSAGTRIFCESDPDALPYIKFDFTPYAKTADDSEGGVFVSIDKGSVLDLRTYNNVTAEFLSDQVKIDYPDGRLIFVLSGDFEHEGSIKHFLTGGIIKEVVTCYYQQ